MIKRALEHEQILKYLVHSVCTKISKGDAFANISYSQSVSFENDKLQSVDDTSYSSIACRCFKNGRVGNAFINNPDHVSHLIQNAKESASFGEKIDFGLPSAHDYPYFDWMNHSRNAQFSKQDLKDFAEELLSQIKKFSPNSKVSTGAYNGYSQFILNNTSGFEGFYESTGFSLQGGLFEIAPDGSFIEIYEGHSFYNQDINFNKILHPLQERLPLLRQSVKLKKSGFLPVIFAPSALDSLLDPIEIAANGRTLCKGISLFAQKLNAQLFSPNFSFYDDPFHLYGSGTIPFDDEGITGKKLPIIQHGVFKNFIFDSNTAKKSNTLSTGHASRSSQSLPVPMYSNRIIGTGSHSLDEMIQSINYGILLTISLGEGQSNVIAGDFSVLGENAFLIENGSLKGRLKDVMLSGNAFELLKNIPMLENKLHKESSLFAPHILVEGVSVSQK